MNFLLCTKLECLKAHRLDCGCGFEKETDASIRVYVRIFAFTSHHLTSHIIFICWPAIACTGGTVAWSINENVVVAVVVAVVAHWRHNSNARRNAYGMKSFSWNALQYFTCDEDRATWIMKNIFARINLFMCNGLWVWALHDRGLDLDSSHRVHTT